MFLAKILRRAVIAIMIVKFDVGGIYVVHVQVAVRVVVSIRLVVFAVSQPPWSAVLGVPTRLLRYRRLHRVFGTAAATICCASHIHDEVWFLWEIRDLLAESVV